MDPRNQDYQEDTSLMKFTHLNNPLGPGRALFCKQQGGKAEGTTLPRKEQAWHLWKPAQLLTSQALCDRYFLSGVICNVFENIDIWAIICKFYFKPLHVGCSLVNVL